jgi:hypothetical protein
MLSNRLLSAIMYDDAPGNLNTILYLCGSLRASKSQYSMSTHCALVQWIETTNSRDNVDHECAFRQLRGDVFDQLEVLTRFQTIPEDFSCQMSLAIMMCSQHTPCTTLLPSSRDFCW